MIKMVVTEDKTSSMANPQGVVSLQNETGHTCLQNYTAMPMLNPNILIPLTTFLTGVIGNIIALVVLHRSRFDCPRSIFYILVAGLVWSDLVGQLVTTPLPLAVYMNKFAWIGGEPTCKFHAFVMMYAGLTTPTIICTMALERYMAVNNAYIYQIKFTKKRAKIYLVCVWLTMLGFAACPLMGWGATAQQAPGTWAYIDSTTKKTSNIAYTYLYAGYSVLMIAITGLCNLFVLLTLLKMRKRRRESIPSEQKFDNRKVKKPKEIEVYMVVLLAAITFVFTVCWMPLMVELFISQASGMKDHKLNLLAVRLATINQILDPWLYILFRKAFFVSVKQHLVKLWTYLSCACLPGWESTLTSSSKPQRTPSPWLEKRKKDPLALEPMAPIAISEKVMQTSNCDTALIPQNGDVQSPHLIPEEANYYKFLYDTKAGSEVEPEELNDVGSQESKTQEKCILKSNFLETSIANHWNIESSCGYSK